MAPAVAERAEEPPPAPKALSPVSIKDHVDHLLTFLRTQQNGQKATDLSRVVEAGLTFAKTRSEKSGAIRENASALVAMGIVVGHSKLAWLVGFQPDEEVLAEIDRLGGRVRLAGRSDLARHFCLSAGLSAISSERLSNLIGRTKEQSDAEAGSGFSFADLLADQAGARLGRLATRDEASAQRIQRMLARKHSAKDYMPSIEGLPEGIPADRLKADYGGIGGEGYRRLEQDIRNRLERCRLFADPPRGEPLERTPPAQ